MGTSEDKAPVSEETTAAAFRLVVCGVDELARFRRCRFSHIVSIMDPDSAVPEVFGSFDAHERIDLRFHDIIDPQVDMVIPNSDHIGQLLRFGGAMMASKSPIKLLAHCHAGVSRSSAAAILVLTAAQSGAPEQALARLLSIAPNAWPNLRMIELGDALIGCKGRLISAVRDHYASMLERYPAIRQMIAVDKHLRATPE
jgi:predicted protein tyrosine phosphatase